MKKRRNFTLKFEMKVVLEFFREEKDLNQLAIEHEIARNMLRNWRKEFLANASNVRMLMIFFLPVALLKKSTIYQFPIL
ncbi:transposase [Marinisporobacter balticus]|uniref:transposase n=1 Tax=Marinisporobacter balticus TaxID=2018667 RepID=UPI00104F6578|nr:transposase [Marinisporobacter balticus]